MKNLEALLAIADNRLALSKLKGEAQPPFNVNPAGKIYVDQIQMSLGHKKRKNKKSK